MLVRLTFKMYNIINTLKALLLKEDVKIIYAIMKNTEDASREKCVCQRQQMIDINIYDMKPIFASRKIFEDTTSSARRTIHYL